MPDPSPSDEDIVREVCSGNTEAFSAIIRSYRNYVFSIIVRNGIFNDEAEEVYQEVFLRVFRKIKSYRPGSHFKNWLFTVALNYVRNHLRRRRLESFLFKPMPEKFEVSDKTEASRDGIDQERQDQVLSKAMGTLPKRYFTVLMLHHHELLSYEEIAVRLQAPIGSVKTWLFRARELLRGKLKQMGETGV